MVLPRRGRAAPVEELDSDVIAQDELVDHDRLVVPDQKARSGYSDDVECVRHRLDQVLGQARDVRPHRGGSSRERAQAVHPSLGQHRVGTPVPAAAAHAHGEHRGVPREGGFEEPGGVASTRFCWLITLPQRVHGIEASPGTDPQRPAPRRVSLRRHRADVVTGNDGEPCRPKGLGCREEISGDAQDRRGREQRGSQCRPTVGVLECEVARDRSDHLTVEVDVQPGFVGHAGPAPTVRPLVPVLLH